MTNNQFWDKLLSIAFLIEETAEINRENALIELSVQLETIMIAFDRNFDPAETYEEYVALALCQAISKTMRFRGVNNESS